jgi:hypothetical protein
MLKIEGGVSGFTSVWKITDEIGNVIAHLQGGGSGAIALAAVEHMNSGNFKWDGWTRRLSEYKDLEVKTQTTEV